MPELSTKAPRENNAETRARSPKRLSTRSPELVTQASHGQDVSRLVRVGLDLAPEPADVDVDEPLVAVLILPDEAQQLLPREHVSPMLHQLGQQLELGA